MNNFDSERMMESGLGNGMVSVFGNGNRNDFVSESGSGFWNCFKSGTGSRNCSGFGNGSGFMSVLIRHTQHTAITHSRTCSGNTTITHKQQQITNHNMFCVPL